MVPPSAQFSMPVLWSALGTSPVINGGVVTIHPVQFSLQSLPCTIWRSYPLPLNLGSTHRLMGTLIQLFPLQASLVSGCQGDFHDPLAGLRALSCSLSCLLLMSRSGAGARCRCLFFPSDPFTHCQLSMLWEATLVWFRSWAGMDMSVSGHGTSW